MLPFAGVQDDDKAADVSSAAFFYLGGAFHDKTGI
jgi:hypothetical protein